MKYKKLGNTGLLVSRLALGAMTFGFDGFHGFRATVDQKQANEIVGKALDAGVNFFDTADVYSFGQSEEILGKALGKRRKDVMIATKFGMRMGESLINFGMSRQHIISAVEASLRRLGTDYIDLYQVHFDDGITPLEEMVSALDNLVKRGLVRYLGFSNFHAWRAATAINIQRQQQAAEFVSAQMYYSLAGRDLELAFVPFAQQYNLGIMVWSPLAGGFLSGKYTPENPDGNGGRLSTFNLTPVNREQGYKLVKVLKRIANAHDASPAQVSLAWLLSKPYVTAVLMGASQRRHFEKNVRAIDLELTAADLKELDELTAPQLPYPNWLYAHSTDPVLERALSEDSLKT